MGNRIALWDNLKFFLVTCVVIGHFVDQFTGLSNIYLFVSYSAVYFYSWIDV